MLCLGHNAALAAPGFECLVAQFLEKPFGFAAFLGFGFSFRQFVPNGSFEPWIAGEAENVVDAVSLTPAHQVLATEA